MSAIKDRNTIAPAEESIDQIADLHGLLAGARTAGESLFLGVAGGSDDNRFVTVPEGVADMIAKIIASLHAGQPISVVPHDTKVTTQEAAEMLGLSRPTVIKLITSGELTCEMVGSHRRLLFADVLAYRNHRREQVQAMLDATRLEDDVHDIEELRQALRAAKVDASKRRREG